jgi:hypothetical protein
MFLAVLVRLRGLETTPDSCEMITPKKIPVFLGDNIWNPPQSVTQRWVGALYLGVVSSRVGLRSRTRSAGPTRAPRTYVVIGRRGQQGWADAKIGVLRMSNTAGGVLTLGCMSFTIKHDFYQLFSSFSPISREKKTIMGLRSEKYGPPSPNSPDFP